MSPRFFKTSLGREGGKNNAHVPVLPGKDADAAHAHRRRTDTRPATPIMAATAPACPIGTFEAGKRVGRWRDRCMRASAEFAMGKGEVIPYAAASSLRRDSMTSMNLSTRSGSNWVPVFLRSSATATRWLCAFRNGRSDVIAE